jgi:hypothetical protein
VTRGREAWRGRDARYAFEGLFSGSPWPEHSARAARRTRSLSPSEGSTGRTSQEGALLLDFGPEALAALASPQVAFHPGRQDVPLGGCQHRPDLRAVSHPLPRTTRRRAVRAPCRRVTEDSATPAGSLSPSCAYRRADSYRAGAFSESPSSSAYSASTISSSYLTRRAIRARPLLCRQPCMASVIGSKAIHAANATVASTSWRAPAEPSSHEGRAPASRGGVSLSVFRRRHPARTPRKRFHARWRQTC